MAGSLALYAENKILEHVVGKTSFTMPATVYVALFTVAPTGEDGTGGTEASAGNYVRKSTAGSDWGAAANGAITNAEDITFVEAATTNWGTMNGFALFDAESGGNMIAWGDITVPKAINIGDAARFEAGDLDISID